MFLLLFVEGHTTPSLLNELCELRHEAIPVGVARFSSQNRDDPTFFVTDGKRFSSVEVSQR